MYLNVFSLKNGIFELISVQHIYSKQANLNLLRTANISDVTVTVSD